MIIDQNELRNLAHDMRNALSSIYGYAQVLEHSLGGAGLEKELHIAKSISESVKKMDRMISDHLNQEKTVE